MLEFKEVLYLYLANHNRHILQVLPADLTVQMVASVSEVPNLYIYI
jgi:hypothetical protein